MIGLSASRLLFFFLVFSLFAGGIVQILHRHLSLGIPLLPSASRDVWFVDASGITTPVRIEFGRRGQIDMPVPKAGEECHKGTKTRKVQVEAIEVTYTLGADRVSRIVLADAPHVLAMADGLQCVRLPGQPF